MFTKLIRAVGVKPLAAVAFAVLSSTAAQAYDGSLGTLSPSLSSTFQIGNDFPSTTFEDTLTFSIATESLASFTAKGQGFVIPNFLVLAPASSLSFAIYKGGSALTAFGTSFSGLHLLAGSDYSFVVKGGSGGYTVTWSTTPVPEPESVALAFAGLAVVAGVARRRSRI